ncbi:MAG: SDR family NAD(P)-dependent oxidoreductase [Ancalomicrobiaceae bacterium]|nr:SDR family NAD(P)-dependent oxidoreductase [Ancalomicrobiaceae bacterium]
MPMPSKVALITGAGSGIGRHTALALLADGWLVALAGRRPHDLQTTAAAAGTAEADVLVVPTDVTDPAAVAHLFAEIDRRFGRLDFVFNNAGTNVPPATVGDLTFDDWRRVVSVNLDGAFLVASAAFRLMRDQTPQGGRIVNNGSISAHVPRPGSAPYTASKHAITGLTRSIALDGRPYNIACGQIDIGNAASDMTEKMSKGVPQANGTLAPEPTMDVGLVAKAVLAMANLPLEANVQFMTLMATAMPYIGRG